MALMCLQPTCIVEDDFSVVPLRSCGGDISKRGISRPERRSTISVGPCLQGFGGPLTLGGGLGAARSAAHDQSGEDLGAPEAVGDLEILCVGFVAVGMHYEYNFRIAHSSGCSWRVQRRYSSLLALHEELMELFTALPQFPPKESLSQHLTSDREVAAGRAPLLHRYFQQLAKRKDILAQPAIWEALGAEKPDPVLGVVALRCDAADDVADLQVRLAVQSEDCCRPVESVEVEVRNAGTLMSVQTAPAGQLVRVRLSRAAPSRGASGAGAPPPGVELRLRARNAVGSSAPVRVSVPATWGARRPMRHAASMPAAFANELAPLGQPAQSELARSLSAGSRVQAVWAGDGGWYDAVVRRAGDDPFGRVTVDWLRPAPLEEDADNLRCVCDSGGDDTMHRQVLPTQLRSAEASRVPEVRRASTYGARQFGGARESI